MNLPTVTTRARSIRSARPQPRAETATARGGSKRCPTRRELAEPMLRAPTALAPEFRAPKSVPGLPNQTSIKAKTPVIVPNQGKSRQTSFFQTAVLSANPPAGWVGPAAEKPLRVPRKNPLQGGEDTGEGERPTNLSNRVALPIRSRSSRSPKSKTRTRFRPSIKAETPAIKANRAKSSLIKAAMKILLPADNRPQPPSLPGIPPFATLRLCAFALKTPSSNHNQASIKAKNPAIVHNQGISRQPMKKLNATITSANGATSYQPRATPWERANRLSPALKGRPIPPIKAKTPAIKANRA